MLVLIAKSVFKSIDWLIAYGAIRCCLAHTRTQFIYLRIERKTDEGGREQGSELYQRWHYFMLCIFEWEFKKKLTRQMRALKMFAISLARRSHRFACATQRIHFFHLAKHAYTHTHTHRERELMHKPIKLIKRCNWRPQTTTALIRARLKQTRERLTV